MSRCEWDPANDRHALILGDKYEGCANQATTCVGADGQWHLCDDCAALSRFKRFRTRKPLRRRS